MSDALHLRIEQFAPATGNVGANLQAISNAARAATNEGVDLLVTPELSLTGYDLRDLTHRVAKPLDKLPISDLGPVCDVILGMVELGGDFVPYNTAIHIHKGEILHAHRKIYLPTYGMFDEGRYFGAGSRMRAYDSEHGWRIGILVCEDLWHPALTYLLAMGGAQVIVVQAAAAGRGGRGGAQGGRYASSHSWENLACAAALAYGVYVVVANRVGAEGSVVFGGGSLIVAPNGEVIARGDDLAEDRPAAELSLSNIRAARRPSAHARDEDPHLVARELRRILRSE